jgi:hypothetical protein
VLYALVEQSLSRYDMEQFGVAQYLYATGYFWFSLLACAIFSFGHRLVERGYVWLFRPQVRARCCCPSLPRLGGHMVCLLFPFFLHGAQSLLNVSLSLLF